MVAAASLPDGVPINYQIDIKWPKEIHLGENTVYSLGRWRVKQNYRRSPRLQDAALGAILDKSIENIDRRPSDEEANIGVRGWRQSRQITVNSADGEPEIFRRRCQC